MLGYAIQSVLAQTVGDFELLIVGDGCTDTTREVIGHFDDKRIKWFDLPKAPLSGYANRNIVLRQAAGQVVAYAQHDDLWFPDHLELLLASLARADAEWAYSRPLWIGPDGIICPSAVNLTLSDELCHFMNIENSIPSSCVMHLRSALERVGYWPEDQVRIADWICWQRMIQSTAKPGVGYCRVPTSLHFRAIWRDFDSLAERTWRPLAQQPWWPSVLTNPPAAEHVQAVLWRVMAEGNDWVSLVREATATVLDRMAWNAMCELLPGIECANAGRAAAEADSRVARAETQDARLATDRAFAILEQVRDAAAASLTKLEAQRETALARTREAATQAAQDRAELQMILSSTIWRATAPVRAAVNALKAMAAQSTRGRARRASHRRL